MPFAGAGEFTGAMGWLLPVVIADESCWLEKRERNAHKNLTRASGEQTMPVDARRGASQSDELQAAHTGGLSFCAGLRTLDLDQQSGFRGADRARDTSYGVSFMLFSPQLT